MEDREKLIYDVRDKTGMFIDSHNDVVIPTKKGDQVVLSEEVAEEVWRLIEKARAEDVVRSAMNIEGDEALVDNVDWLANTFNDVKEDFLNQVTSFLCEMVLKEFDLEMLE